MIKTQATGKRNNITTEIHDLKNHSWDITVTNNKIGHSDKQNCVTVCTKRLH